MSRLSWVVAIGGVLLLVLVLVSNLSPLGWGRGSGMMGFGFPMMGMMGLGMLLFWVLIIGGVASLAQPFVRGSGSSWTPPQTESPFDILKKRYSRGEITKVQFEEMKRDLGL